MQFESKRGQETGSTNNVFYSLAQMNGIVAILRKCQVRASQTVFLRFIFYFYSHSYMKVLFICPNNNSVNQTKRKAGLNLPSGFLRLSLDLNLNLSTTDINRGGNNQGYALPRSALQHYHLPPSYDIVHGCQTRRSRDMS